MSRTEHPSEELNTWGEIAAHLGVSVRAAQIWEKKLDLPVRRRGSRVFAFPHELDGWRTRQEARTESARRSWRPARAALAAAIVVLVALGAFILIRGALSQSSWDSQQARWVEQRHGRFILVSDRNEEVGRSRFFGGLHDEYYAESRSGLNPGDWWLIGDADHEGGADVFVVVQSAERTEQTARLVRLAASGELWSITLDQPYPGEAIAPVYSAFIAGLTWLADSSFLIVVTKHSTRYPASVLLIDAENGAIEDLVWHPGSIYAVKEVDLDYNGKSEWLFGAANNPGAGLGHAGLLHMEIVQKRSIRGVSYSWEVRDYLLFPRTFVEDTLRQFPRTFEIAVMTDGDLMVSVGLREHPVYYHLDKRLAVTQVVYDNILRKRTVLAVEQGLLPPIDEAEIESWQKVVRLDYIANGTDPAIEVMFNRR